MRSLKRHLFFFRLNPAEYLRAWRESGTGLMVRSGPFRGMPYITRATCSAHGCKITGTYEKELHAIVEEVNRETFDLIVNIGTAEGYYAIGLARHHRQARLVAYEGDPKAVKLLRRLAARNGLLDRLEIQGYCTSALLRQTLASQPESQRRTLIVIDAEGAEDEIFSGDPAPFRTSTILMETHDFHVPGITEKLSALFAPTHQGQVIEQTPRTLADLPIPTRLTQTDPARVLKELLDEGRGDEPMKWLYLKPRSL